LRAAAVTRERPHSKFFVEVYADAPPQVHLRDTWLPEPDQHAAPSNTHVQLERGENATTDEAREVALPMFILLPPEYHEDEQDRELAEKERQFRLNPPVVMDADPDDK
jgi:hypothetical protein